MSYNVFETHGRRVLEQGYPDYCFFKLSCQNNIDLIGVNKTRVMLVEIKSTKYDVFYPCGDKRKREQWKGYFAKRKELMSKNIPCDIVLIVKVGYRNTSRIHIFTNIKKMEDLPKSVRGFKEKKEVKNRVNKSK